MIVDLDSLQGGNGPGSLGGHTDLGALDREACRRLACDGALTRVLATRQPTTHHRPDHHPTAEQRALAPDPTAEERLAASDPEAEARWPASGPDENDGLKARLRVAAALLPPILGGAPSLPLDVGRASRVVHPAQRTALAVRDGGCVFPGCDRPLEWCEAHHLLHWLDGGPTDLANLALLCRAHHRAVHEGGWRRARAPDGRLTATPPQRPHRRQPAA